MKKTSHFTISYCICPNCKNKFPIPRKGASNREKKHLKKIWCPFCKEEVNMMEIREQDFYQNAYGSTIGRYEEADTTESETFYINKNELMQRPEMYEFDFK